MKPLIEIILKRSWLVILGFIVVTALIMSGAARIKVDTSGQVFQPDHHPILTINDEIKKTFGSNGDSVIGVLEGDIYNPQSLNQIRALTAKLEAIPGTEQVISLTNVGRLEEHDGLIESKDLVSKDDLKPNEIAAVRDYISRNSNSLVSSDGRSTVVISQMKPEAVQQKFGSDVSNLLREGWKGKVALAGKPFILAEINRTIANDLQVVGGVALGLIVVFLFLNFGSWHGVVLPLIQVFFGMNLGLGLYGWIGGTAGSLTTIAIIAIWQSAAVLPCICWEGFIANWRVAKPKPRRCGSRTPKPPKV
jgi:uncharacterized protein